MDYDLQAADLLDRLKKHLDVLDEKALSKMIEDTIYMAVQDHINEENFRNIKTGDTFGELGVLLRKSKDHLEESKAYLEAAYLTVSSLEKEAKEDKFIAAKLNTIDIIASVRYTIEKINFVVSKLNVVDNKPKTE